MKWPFSACRHAKQIEAAVITSLMILNLSVGAGFAGTPPSLDLFSPVIVGLNVTVNGATQPGTTGSNVTRIRWNWGDGDEEDHWFANSHTYSIAGYYTITVTSYQSDGLSTTKSIDVSVTSASAAITINSDGSITPSTAPIQRNGDTYTLTGNIAASADGIVINRNGIVLDGAGYTVTGSGNGHSGITLNGNSGVTVRNITVRDFSSSTSGGIGIALSSSSSDTLTGNTLAGNFLGIDLSSSSGNTLSGNTVTAANTGGGILLYSSSNNVLSGNNIANNNFAIWLWFSSGNTLSGNKVVNSGYGIQLISSSSNNVLSGNIATNNQYAGISLSGSSNGNVLSGNSITANNEFGIMLSSSSSNSVFHNSFVNNAGQVYTYNSANTWDNGYPSGGNYWSDYTTKYLGATEIDNSGLWNTPYVIDTNNKDNYPLMRPWGSPPLTSSSTSVSCSPNPAPVSSSVTCTATVSGSNPTGKVTWSKNSSTGSFSASTCTLSSGSCSTTYTDTSAGTVTITASYSGDSNNAPNSGSTTLTVSLWSVATNWDLSRDMYSFINPSTVFSADGWCYGMSSTAILYFEQYFQTPLANPSAPFFPSQQSPVHSTYDLQASASDKLNNVTLAILVHQAFDPQNKFSLLDTRLMFPDEKSEFNKLGSYLVQGQPVVLVVYNNSLTIHDVVAWAERKLPNGNYSIAVSDPDLPGWTAIASYNPASETFDYDQNNFLTPPTGGNDYTKFLVTAPQPIQSSWFTTPPSGWTSTFEPNYWVVMADKNITVETNTSPSESDTFSEVGNSQSFVDNIEGSCGISEGNVEVYALQLPKGWQSLPSFPYVVHDPSQSDNSNIMMGWVDDSSGQPVGYGYLLNAATTQGSLDFTATPSGAGLLITAGDTPLNATITCFTATQQGSSVSQVLTEQIGADQNSNPTTPCTASFTASKTVVGQGYSVPMNVTINNAGDNPENVSFTFSANSTILGSEMVPDLLNETSVNLVYGVNTSSLAYGNYTLSAYCEPNGINEAANNFTYTGSLTVTIPGDINGDFKVSLADIVLLANAYGSHPSQAKWNPNADIDGNGVIGLSDLVLLANHYGQHYP